VVVLATDVSTSVQPPVTACWADVVDVKFETTAVGSVVCHITTGAELVTEAVNEFGYVTEAKVVPLGPVIEAVPEALATTALDVFRIE
jgi:hypothetical protein